MKWKLFIFAVYYMTSIGHCHCVATSWYEKNHLQQSCIFFVDSRFIIENDVVILFNFSLVWHLMWLHVS